MRKYMRLRLMSVCLRNSLCMQSHCFVFLEALFMAKCFIFLNKKIYYFYETHKKHMKDALSSQKKRTNDSLFLDAFPTRKRKQNNNTKFRSTDHEYINNNSSERMKASFFLSLIFLSSMLF